MVVSVCLSTLLSYFSAGNGVLIINDLLWEHDYEATTSNHCGEAPPGTQRPPSLTSGVPHITAHVREDVANPKQEETPLPPALCLQDSLLTRVNTGPFNKG